MQKLLKSMINYCVNPRGTRRIAVLL